MVREYHAAARMLGDSGIPEELTQQVLTPEDIRAMMVEVDPLRYAMVPPAVAAASDPTESRPSCQPTNPMELRTAPPQSPPSCPQRLSHRGYPTWYP